MIGTLAAARRRTGGVSPAQLTGVTYSQSSVWSANAAADYSSMNDGTADGSVSTRTGTDITSPPTLIKADCGSIKTISHVIIGYDYLSNLNPPGDWGVTYTEGRELEGSTDDSSWTSIATLPTYASTGSSNGLVQITVSANYRYIRVRNPSNYYTCLTEFQIWGN